MPLLVKPATYQPRLSAFFFWFFPTLHIWGSVCKPTEENFRHRKLSSQSPFVGTCLAFTSIIWVREELCGYTGILGFIALCLIVLHRYCVCVCVCVCLCQIEELWQLSIKQVGTIFTIAFVHLVSLCHTLVICTIFQPFSLSFYVLWGSVISDLWCYYKTHWSWDDS